MSDEKCSDGLLLGRLAEGLYEDLTDDQALESRVISRCGRAVLQLVRGNVRFLLKISSFHQSLSGITPSTGDIVHNLETLLALADENINTTPYSLVEPCWLRLYTDVSIIRGVFDVALAQTHVSTVKAAIRRLDMAIIVGGGVGPRRQEWIQALLNMLSNRLPAEHRSGSEPLERSNKRRKTGNDGNREPLLFAPNRIPSRRLPPTVLQYITEDSKRPFILREHLASGASNMPPWPALHRWKLASYLLEAVGEGRVVPVEVGAAYDDSDWGQRIIPFRDFLARAGFDVDPETEGASEGPPLYLAQHPLFTQFPVLQRDISLPDFVWSDPPPPTYMPDYSPPPNDVGVIINVWIGSGSGEIVSPAHTDPYYNCYAQVLGRKRVWLAPPGVGKHMQAYGTSGETPSSLAEEYMTNTSKVPILRPVDAFERLRPVYPQFFENVWPVSMEAVLEPGDMLVMPPGWWHAMRAEGDEPCWNVSMWY